MIMEMPLILEKIEQTDALFLKRIWSCITRKCKEPGFGVNRLSEYMSISRSQLNRRLLNLTGYPTARLIMHFRLYYAKQLLSLNHYTVKEVACECGFSRHTSFCRSFYNEFNCSPSSYRDIVLRENNDRLFDWNVPLSDDDLMYLLDIACKTPWLGKLLYTIIANLGNQNLSIADLAAAAYMSTSSLNRKTQKLLSVTPQKLIGGIKLQYVCELLALKSFTINDIAYKAGFFDAAHLCRYFKATLGYPISAYQCNGSRKISINWIKEKLMRQNEN